MSSRLELVSTVRIPAIGTFSVDAHFKVGETDGVKIGWLGENFRKVFLCGNSEKTVAEATLRVHNLLKPSTDGLIIAELGGEVVAEITLGQLWYLLKTQGHGEQGNLLISGSPNIFYIRGGTVLWAVGCRWISSCGVWFVNVYPISGQDRWYSGQVVSR